MPNHRPEAIANEFLRRAGSNGLTQMQLQKLVYIAHGWTLGLLDEPLTNIEPQAWDRGPVYPELRNRTMHAGATPLTGPIMEFDYKPAAIHGRAQRGSPIISNFTNSEREIIDATWDKYGSLTGFALSDLTHQPNSPWHFVYYNYGKDKSISNREIKEYYRKMIEKVNQNQNSG